MKKQCSQEEKQLLYENRKDIIYSSGFRKLKKSDFCNGEIAIDCATIIDVEANWEKNVVYVENGNIPMWIMFYALDDVKNERGQFYRIRHRHPGKDVVKEGERIIVATLSDGTYIMMKTNPTTVHLLDDAPICPLSKENEGWAKEILPHPYALQLDKVPTDFENRDGKYAVPDKVRKFGNAKKVLFVHYVPCGGIIRKKGVLTVYERTEEGFVIKNHNCVNFDKRYKNKYGIFLWMYEKHGRKYFCECDQRECL